MNQHKANAQESRIRAEAELLDIQKQVLDISSQLDLRPDGTLHDATTPSANKFDQIVDPPDPSEHIQFGCVRDESFISKINTGHIFERSYPHPTEAEPERTLPIHIETHVLFSSLASNPDRRRSVRTIVNSMEVAFDTGGPFVFLETTNKCKAPRPLPDEGGGAIVANDTTPQNRASLHMRRCSTR